MVPSTCEYSRDPIVTKSQVAPCRLLVLIYCPKVLVWSVLAGAIGAHGDGAPYAHGKLQEQLSSSTLTVTLTASGVTPPCQKAKETPYHAE